MKKNNEKKFEVYEIGNQVEEEKGLNIHSIKQISKKTEQFNLKISEMINSADAFAELNNIPNIGKSNNLIYRLIEQKSLGKNCINLSDFHSLNQESFDAILKYRYNDFSITQLGSFVDLKAESLNKLQIPEFKNLIYYIDSFREDEKIKAINIVIKNGIKKEDIIEILKKQGKIDLINKLEKNS